MNKITKKAIEKVDRLNEHIGIYKVFQSTFDKLNVNIEIDHNGITTTPLDNPTSTLEYLEHHLGIIFTRQLNSSGLDYSWVSELEDTPIIIEAHECFDLTGTVATPKPTT